ncbi:FtsH-binding integral membrane protein [Kineosporia succinea]|uniref:FtsH-binding integral membrane protein n=1 Tax=Kineosporia succinea TaxID=84632 RepID=A0ABT9P412_9ACTN|nr:FtsH-binding integral membrane protein [Kineosporia succinea]
MLLLIRRRVDPELVLVAVVALWIGMFLLVDAAPVAWVGGHELARQLVLGIATWAMLAHLLRRESVLVRWQTMLVVLFASIVEYTFSPLLEAYTYRIGTVPMFVPPGHGLVYLAALALGRSGLVRRHARLWSVGTVVAGGAWALHGLFLAERPDVLGAFWFLCLLGFMIWGRARLLYVGAFVVVTYLELLGTALHTWSWAPYDPVLGVISQGNPPSGAAGGYGWFDLYATLLAPRLQSLFSSSRVSAWRRPLVATALPPNGPSLPSSEVNVPPASTTIGTSAAMSYNASSGSQARSTAPSASSMYDQKSP